MSLPSLVLTPRGGRGRYGRVEPTLSGTNVDVLPDGWRLWKGLGEASLLLSPEGSYDRSGVVTPSLSGGVTVEDGMYGKAWRHHMSGDNVNVLSDGYVLHNKGTVIVRVEFPAPGAANLHSVFAIADTTAMRFTLSRDSSRRAHAYVGNPARSVVSPQIIPDGKGAAIGIKWDATGNGALYPNGTRGAGFTYSGPAVSPGRIHTTLTGSAYGHAIETMLVYPDALSDAEIARIGTMPRRWEWGPDGTLTAPHPQPIGDLFVRYREGGTIKTQHLYGPQRFGEHGILRWEDGELIVTTDGMVELLGIVAYPASASVTASGMANPAGEVVLGESNIDLGDGITLWKGLGDPALLLSPELSRDRSGEVSPAVGANVTTVEGEYGTAWKFPGSSQNVSIQRDRPETGTLFIRGRAVREGTHATFLYWPYTQDGRMFGVMRYHWNQPIFLYPESLRLSNSDSTTGFDTFRVSYVSIVRWSPEGATFTIVTDQGTASESGPAISNTAGAAGAAIRLGYYANEAEVESFFFTDEWLSDEETLRIGGMPRRWEWGPDGELRIPLPTRTVQEFREGTTNLHPNPNMPSSSVYWAYEEQSATYHGRVVAPEPSPFGTAVAVKLTWSAQSSWGLRGLDRINYEDGLPVTPGRPVTFSMWVYPEASGSGTVRVNPALVGRSLDVVTLESVSGGMIDIPLNEWSRVSMTYAFTESTRVRMFAVRAVSDNGNPMSGAFYATDAQIEDKPYATPFTVGTRPDQYVPVEVPVLPSEIRVQYREGTQVVTEIMDAPGPFGDYGTMEVDDFDLVVGTTRQTDILSIVLDSDATDDDRMRIMGSDVWSWNTVLKDPTSVIIGDIEVGIGLIVQDVEADIGIIVGEAE